MTMFWPKRVIKSLGRVPQVGDWFAECCIEDLHEIESEAELEYLVELYDEIDSGGKFFKSEEEARAALNT